MLIKKKGDNDMNDVTLENFISFCDEMQIVEEGKKWTDKDRANYKKLKRVMNSPMGLRNQYAAQKKQCEQRLTTCRSSEDCEAFIVWLHKQQAGIQRKINGVEVKNKKPLEKFMKLYKEYEKKAGGRKWLIENH